MDHIHEVYDTGIPFEIDAETRGIKNISGSKVTLVQFDHNSERFTFKVPRYIDGHDMSTCNLVQAHFNNIDQKVKTEYRDMCPIDDLHIDPEDEENFVLCSWLVSAKATQYAGILAFQIHFMCTSDDVNIGYRWNTLTFDHVVVASGMNNSEVVVQEYSDALLKWETDIEDALSELRTAKENGDFDGVSIVEVVQTTESTEDNGVNDITVRLSDGGEYVFHVRNGSKGSKGDTGDTGPQGIQGIQGIQGEQGEQGPQGEQGIQGNPGTDGTSVTVSSVSESTEDSGSNVVTFSDGKTLTVKNGSKGSKGDTGDPGADGSPGANGKDGVGIKSIVQTTTSTADDGNNVITITLTDGTTATFTVQNGSKGSTGEKGETGATGPAYTLTDTDKSTIAAAVKASLTTETWTFTLEDGSTVTKAVYVGEIPNVTVTITGSGDDVAGVNVNGESIRESATVEVPVGTIVQCYTSIESASDSNMAYLSINGVKTYHSTCNGIYPEYVVMGNVTINIGYAYGSDKYGYIEITEQ